MDKIQALHKFWSSFKIPAYDQYTVKPETALPYITYDVAVTPDNEAINTASIWYKGMSWAEIQQKCDEISKAIGIGGMLIKTDDGYIWIKRGTPFAQRMGDDNELIRRIVLNIIVDYLSAD